MGILGNCEWLKKCFQVILSCLPSLDAMAKAMKKAAAPAPAAKPKAMKAMKAKAMKAKKRSHLCRESSRPVACNALLWCLHALETLRLYYRLSALSSEWM